MLHQVGTAHLKCKKILTDAAKFVIQEAFKSGAHVGKEEKREPPFMAPSTDPSDYSIVSAMP